MDATCPLCTKIARPEHLPPEDVVWQFPFSTAFLGPWQFYTGYCVLVARRHVQDLNQLPPGERRAFLEEMCLLGQAIERAFQPRKMNYELLGNQVPHPHWHLFPRSVDDPETLKPAWIAIERADHSPGERTRLENGLYPRPEISERLRIALKELVPPG